MEARLARCWLAVASAGLAMLIAAGCGGASHKAGVAGPSEVQLQKTSTPGPNPFTAPVGKDVASIKAPAIATPNGGASAFTGNLPGLYGGTQNSSSCDGKQLVTFLESNPSKAQAWASTLGIQTTQITSYIGGLTPVILRTDTRVTNHGFVNGTANAIPALLQAGTAVFVDNYGKPVVKCYCGNPLTAPTPLAAPRYTGPAWPGFAPGHITIINQSTTIINVFKLFDPSTGTIFARPAGSSGQQDGPPKSSTPPSGTPTTPTATQPQQTTTAQTPSAPNEQPSASFSPSSGTRGDTYTLSASGFAPNVTLGVTLTRPDGVVEHYSISTSDSGSGSYTFQPTGGNTPTGTYSAVVRNPQTGAQAQASTSVSP